MGKRVLLFLVTNLLIVVTLSIVLSLLGVGRYTGGSIVPLIVFSLVWGFGGAFISLAISRWSAKMATGAQLIEPGTTDPTLAWVYNTVAQQARQANLPMPQVAIYESPEVNAFATGPSKKRSLVAVSTGLLRGVDRAGVEAVLGHEMTHIGNGDMVTMTLLQGTVNAFVLFFSRLVGFAVRQVVDSRYAYMISMLVTILLDIVLGLFGAMLTAWFSRQREFRADAGGARLAGRASMISALKQLARQHEMVDPNQPSLATLKIAGTSNFMKLFATHPPLEVRIAALEAGR